MSEAGNPADPAPEREYTRRLEQRRARHEVASRRELRLSNLRLAVFLVGAVFVWFVLARDDLSALWALLAIAAFVATILAHDDARRVALRAERATRFYERSLARLRLELSGSGPGGQAFADAAHPYATQLDLFGPGALFELLCGAQTGAGEHTLARWLLEPADPPEILARQAAVAELRPGLDLREDLATLGPEVQSGVHPEALARWGSAPVSLAAPSLRLVALGLVALSVAAAAGWAWVGTGPLPLAATLVAQTAFALRLRRRVSAAAEAVDPAAHDLRLLSVLLARLEREDFRAERLVALRAQLETDGAPPSVQVRALLRRVELLDSRRNQLFAPIAPLLLWTTQCALAIEAWRAQCGPRLGGWIEAVGELEALSDLAAYAYDHPADPFPELAKESPCFDGRGLGHPLIPEAKCVRNDVALSGERCLLIVSGSNMSGKSTLLRTLGINAVLAQAGAPVRARSLRLSPLAVGASLRVVDSLRDGTSHFYAEITLLRRIVDLAVGPRPLLFLLDEILSGTNSHDRRIGAAGILKGLVRHGAIGLVTTHDLALARIADDVGRRATNVHFEDELREGELFFDYRLRPGVVERSNALQLMRAVGLDLDAATPSPEGA